MKEGYNIMDQKQQIIEIIQKMTARTIATNPAGYRLCLIGGFRYRLLDHSARMSADIDYHFEADLSVKQSELISLFQRRLIPEIKRRLEHDGSASAATGPEADSPAVRIVNLAFWKAAANHGRIEIPVEITRIICFDKIIVRAAEGVVYPTPSDADLIESKVIAVFSRHFLQHRDLPDIYLFSDRLISGSPTRIMKKMDQIGIAKEDAQDRLSDLKINLKYHSAAVDRIIDSQFESGTAANIQAAGGGKMIVKEVINILTSQTADFLKENR